MQTKGIQPNYEALLEADRDGIYIEALACYPYMMTVEDAAEFLGQTRQAITQYLREGRMFGVKSGRYWRIPKTRFIDFLYLNENDERTGRGRGC